ADLGNPPMRVDGPPFNSATTQVAGSTANTVVWYRGEAGADPARQTASARVDTSISVSYGARANEDAFRNVLSSIAAFASMTFNAADPDGSARYQAIKERVAVNLAPQDGVQKVSDVQAELAAAQTTMAAGKDRQSQTQSAL